MSTKVLTPMTSAPSATNKNWLHYSVGGYNYCVKITSAGSCIPNCVGFAWGRWRQLLGKKHNLSLSNAEDWFVNTKDGYTRGQTPKLGAVICWRGGRVGDNTDGRGHVGVVEKIYSDKSVLCSMSDAGGSRFYTMTLKPPYALSGLTFQGFIYPPTTFTEKTTNSTTTKTRVTASSPARAFSASVAGTYKATAALHCRDAAGTSAKSLVVMPKGQKVKCYGYYTDASGTRWLYVQFTYKSVTYTGFSSADYLQRV